jgi:hypothetical protein
VTKHTPGPWTRSGLAIYEGGIPVAKIATACLADTIGDDEERDWNERSARGFDESVRYARLIAAAPELLEALKLAESHYLESGPLGRSDTVGVLRAAIARAEGRE